MARLGMSVTLCGLLVAMAVPCALGVPPEMEACVGDLVRPFLDSGAMVGLVVGVVDEGGSAIYGYGQVSTETNDTLDGNSIFEIGAVTNVFCTLLLAEMVRSGQVGLEDEAGQYLPEDVTLPVCVDNPDRKITLLDLATHTSGLPRVPQNLSPVDPDDPYRSYTIGQMYSFLSTCSLRDPPGTSYGYSNIGVGLLGHILELVTGLSFQEMVVQEICRPLVMPDTRVILAEGKKDRLAQGHDADGFPVGGWHIPAMPALGALHSTVNDLLVFVSANLSLVETPLLPAMEMTHEPRRAISARGSQIGLGWNIQPGGVIWHHGQTAGFHSFVGFLKEMNVGVVVLTNSATMITDRLALTILKKLAGEDIEPVEIRTPVAIDPKIFERYVGTYELPQDVIVDVFRKDQRLMIQPRGQTASRMYALADTLFFLRVVDAEVEFLMDWDSGEATHLIWTQGDQELAGNKIE